MQTADQSAQFILSEFPSKCFTCLFTTSSFYGKKLCLWQIRKYILDENNHTNTDPERMMAEMEDNTIFTYCRLAL